MSGKKSTISNVTPAIGAIQIQQSTYGGVIPIVWGRTRLAGNLIWYGDFKAVPHTETTQTGGKGGGGGTETSNTTYTYTASVMMALCEGPVLDVITTWRGKQIFSGQSYNGATAQTIDTTSYPASGTTYTVSNPTGWRNVGVQVQVQAAYQDDYTYNRAGQWVPLALGRDYTCSNGVYTFLNASQYQGCPVRVSYTFASGNTGSSCLSEIGLELHSGTQAQAPWSYLQSYHPDQAVGYSGVAYVAGANYSLDGSASVENHAFEVQTAFAVSASVPDADPSRILPDALTNPAYGVNFGLEKIGPLLDYSNACLAQGIVLSPALTEQTSAADFLNTLATLTNVGLVWSSGVLKLIPYADTPLTGNGVTYTPNTAPIYDLTDDDFQPDDDEGPVKVTRGAVSDSFNSVKVEFLDRANDYNIAIMPATDQADIQENGLRQMPTVSAHWITDANVAKVVAQLILQRSLFIRNTYEFTLGWTKIALEPMDLVTLTDTNLGLQKQPVRILSIEEDDSGKLAITAEDFPKGSASATLYPTNSGSGYTPNYNAPAGSALAPVIFESPAALTTAKSNLEVWLAAGGTDPNYGGCEVWISLDGSNYQRTAILKGSSRYGTTTTAMGADAQPGVVSESVNVSLVAGGQILSGSTTDRDRLTTLCYVDGEFLSFDSTTLTGQNAYRLGPSLLRGAYGSGCAAHAAGSKFVRCDDGIAKMTLTGDYIGQMIYVKLLSFNIFGGATQGLGDVQATTYTVTGAQANLSPLAPPNLALEGPFTIDTCRIKWDAAARAATYNVQVWAGATLVKRRAVSVGAAQRFDYSADDARTDGGPWRALEFRVQGVNANGALGAFAVLDVSNPQVGALTGVAITPSSGSIDFSCTPPTDPDFAGIQLWISTTQNFTPAPANLVYDGPATQVSIKRDGSGALLVAGTFYYIKWAGYDSFDKMGLVVGASDATQMLGLPRQVANVQLYQWAGSKPNVPAGVSVFDWTTGLNGSYNGSDSWTSLQPANPGGTAQLWAANVTISVPGGTTTTNISYGAANIYSLSQNGAAAASGFQVATAQVFQWSSSAIAPAAPTGTASFKWSDGTFGAAPSGWSLTGGTAPSPGMTLYVARVSISDSGAVTSTTFSWQNAQIGILSSAPYAGASNIKAYALSSYTGSTVAPASTSGIGSVPANNSGNVSPSSWSQTAPGTIPAGSYLYVCDGIFNPTNNTVVWSAPYQSSARFGSLASASSSTGKLTVTDVISDAAGNWSVDANGLATMRSFKLVDPNNGATILQAGSSLAAAYAAPGTVNTAITMGADGTLSGAGGGKASLSGMGQNAFRVVTKGWAVQSNTVPTTPGLYINGATLPTYTPGTSYTVIVITRATGVIVSSTLYNVLSNSANDAANMAAALNALTPASMVVVIGFDEPQSNRLANNLDTAMYRCGASRAIYGSPNFKYRGAYVLVGIPGVGEGNGAEAYQGASDSDVNAWVDVGFTLVQGIVTGVAGATKPKALSDFGYSGSLTATTNNVTQGTGLPAAGNGGNGDFFFSTDTKVLYQKVNGTWVASANNYTNTNQLTDGAGLGATATWTGVSGSGKPADNATVGAPIGTNVGGTDAGLVASRALNGDSAYNAVNNGSTGLASRLLSNAINVLSGIGGLVAGSLTYDGNGNRTGGYGVATNQKGIVAFRSDGLATFVIDAGSGAVTARSLTILGPGDVPILTTDRTLAQQAYSNPNLCPTPIGMVMYGGASGNRNGDVRFGDGQYVYLPPTSDSSYCGANSGPLRIPASSYYTVSFDVYCNSNSGRTLNVDIAGTGVDSNGIAIVPTTTMTRYKFSEQMPASGTNGDASLRMFTVASGGDVFIISSIKVELGNTMTPWCDSVITPANSPTFIQQLAVNLAQINTASIGQLSALTATIGLLRTASSGARVEISDNLIVGYRSNNTMAYKISS